MSASGTHSVSVINRQEELGEFTLRLDRLRADLSVFDCVLFVHGVPSVGKTTLLGEMRRQAERLGVLTAQIDFDQEASVDGRLVDNLYDGPSGQVQVARTLMQQFSENTGFQPERPILPQSELAPDEAAGRFVDFARHIHISQGGRPFVLLFDTIEDGNPEMLLWVQNKILVPLLQQPGRLLVVLASQKRPNISRQDLIYPLERRMYRLHLRPFDRQSTETHLRELKSWEGFQGDDPSFYTSGLPGLNVEAARYVALHNSTDDLLDHLVLKIIFRRLQRSKGATKDDVTIQILAVSVLRQFDSGLLRRLMNELWHDRYPSRGLGPVHALLLQLEQSNLVEGHPDGYGYTVPHDLRLVLDRYLQKNDLSQHFRVHLVAARWFKEQVENQDYVAIADRIYHLGGLWRDVDRSPGLAAQFDDDLEKAILSTDRAAHLMQELDAALDALKKRDYRVYDLANKIQNVLGLPEFKFVLDPQILKRLVAKCAEFKEEIAQT